MRTIRYGMIGFGGIAENRIAKEGFAKDTKRFPNGAEGIELVGTWDLNPARQAAAEALGLKWYENTDAMLADPTLDAIYVATNNLTHVENGIKAMNAGKHAMLEKPAATNVADALKLQEVAKAKGLSLGVDHMMIYNSRNVLAHDLVASKAIGDVTDGCFHMEFAYGYDPAEARTWRCSNIAEMGGPIGDVASHCFYVGEYIFGEEIVELGAVYYPKMMSIKAEDGAYIKCKLASGKTISAKVAFSETRGGGIGTLGNLGYELYGTEGALRGYGTMFQLSGYADEPYAIRLEMDLGKETKLMVPETTPNIYTSCIQHHAESIRTGKLLDGSDAIHNLKLCALCHESAAQGGKFLPVK